MNKVEDVEVNSLEEKNISDQVEEAVVEEVIDFAEILPVSHEESNFTITNELEKKEKKVILDCRKKKKKKCEFRW